MDIEIEIVIGTTPLAIDIELTQPDAYLACPLITGIFGGAPDTPSYPAVNGIIKGGTP